MKIYSLKRNYDEYGQCSRCPYCGNGMLSIEVLAYDGGHVSEYTINCNKCKSRVNYWSYGSYSLMDRYFDRSVEAALARIVNNIKLNYTEVMKRLSR